MASLVLGTVQLGMPYGVANTTGKPDQKTATDIVRVAWENGIREFDTAQNYGASEQVLGAAFRELGITKEVRVVSKLHKDIDIQNRDAVVAVVQESLMRLGVPQLHGLLLHKEELLDHTIPWLKEGIPGVSYIGASVYSPERALHVITTEGIRIVQFPTNILDRRFERADVSGVAKDKRIQLYIRSVFLQGLLLMRPDALSAQMRFAELILERVQKLEQEMHVHPQILALQYIKKVFPEAYVIIGAETPEQVQENIAAWNVTIPDDIVHRVREVFLSVNPTILDPRVWPRHL